MRASVGAVIAHAMFIHAHSFRDSRHRPLSVRVPVRAAVGGMGKVVWVCCCGGAAQSGGFGVSGVIDRI